MKLFSTTFFALALLAAGPALAQETGDDDNGTSTDGGTDGDDTDGDTEDTGTEDGTEDTGPEDTGTEDDTEDTDTDTEDTGTEDDTEDTDTDTEDTDTDTEDTDTEDTDTEDTGTDTEDTDTEDTDTDTGDGPDPATFSANPCWNEKCVEQTEACIADEQCVAYNDCYLVEDQACMQAILDESPDSVQLHQDLRECGWTSCNDPSAGSCADPGLGGEENRCSQWNDAWPCNCDDACAQFNDCCDDYEEVCQGGDTGDPECSCEDKVCGDDGCGGSCGDCAPGLDCEGGQCVEACTDECAAGDVVCDGDDALLCIQKDGCLTFVAEGCAVQGLICADGACVEGADDTGTEDTGTGDTGGTDGTDGTGDDTTGGVDGTGDGSTDSGGGDRASSGCSTTHASDAAPLVLLLGLLGLLAFRRREDTV